MACYATSIHMAAIENAFGPLLDSTQNPYQNLLPFSESLYQCLETRNEIIPNFEETVWSSNCTFSPETVKATECVGRYNELSNDMNKINVLFKNWNENTNTVNKYMDQLLDLQNNHTEISKLLSRQYENDTAADTMPLKEMSDVLATYITAIQGSIQSWNMYKKNEIMKLEAKLSECNKECSVLRDFFAAGIRELHPNTTSEHLCSICFTNTVDSAISCGHTFCKECIDKLPARNEYRSRSLRKCPTCRTEIDKVIKLYFS